MGQVAGSVMPVSWHRRPASLRAGILRHL